MVTWNKVVRREIYLASGARFLDSGRTRTCRCRAAAAAAQAHQRAARRCYDFRRERPGSATKSGDRAGTPPIRRLAADMAEARQGSPGGRSGQRLSSLPRAVRARRLALLHCPGHTAQGRRPSPMPTAEFLRSASRPVPAFKLPVTASWRLPERVRAHRAPPVPGIHLLDPVTGSGRAARARRDRRSGGDNPAGRALVTIWRPELAGPALLQLRDELTERRRVPGRSGHRARRRWRPTRTSRCCCRRRRWPS